MACAEQPHLILLDCDLPDINGLQLGRMLRNNPLTGSIPLLAVSASHTAQDQRTASEFGFAGFYTKPFNIEALTQHIQQLLAQQENI